VNIFHCQSCDQVVFFENTQCMTCGAVLGFLPERLLMSALEPAGGDRWRPPGLRSQRQLYRMCRNYSREQVCNWMLPADSGETFCAACRFNRTIPDLNVTGNRLLWRRLETGKRRLFYSLLRMGIPLVSKQEDPVAGLAFAFQGDAYQDKMDCPAARVAGKHRLAQGQGGTGRRRTEDKILRGDRIPAHEATACTRKA